MNIKVKTLTGKEIEIDIETDDTISRIKERVEEKEGIPPPQQRLIFGGKQMNDDKKAGGAPKLAPPRHPTHAPAQTYTRLTFLSEPAIRAAPAPSYPSASEYNIEGGSVLHLVLALRGGRGH
ncbi:hypothetical protein EMIHUDRAFT_454555 [Emiliania huxleyi CCMP1516]|uniref:Ubiquitin-like domain-containing protein n=2 Tax=Emiliania huxleyi TaxID=2903 RepID=A0A0D3KSJ4_EMIH1|nr:hypothetical protein EMIHUDRAFT_455157 [Emiliania huxleyi CCMP1516]XP_005791158.1 hypothetical protein EMIHUDRAFT_454555 [Emiliania huxleyi CCMP1516]EOD36186.1 hypothetical protein EMIHUDRAFT_455157 [Emiliania huxleyi CCMP1516]EOD38729.1 hypothetical protein EMIHUDRAFT_454555 [Emiliania huxleyi CCMP1516]|eukprot:XP_005788615.1 hypothetical protein EMIHUDRAFT_455157 [Emiliania huxleyi CCMP1516]